MDFNQIREKCNVEWLKFWREYKHILPRDEEGCHMIFLAGFSAGLGKGIDDTVDAVRAGLKIPKIPQDVSEADTIDSEPTEAQIQAALDFGKTAEQHLQG